MNRFQTGLFDCCNSKHTTVHGHVVHTSRCLPVKAFFCPCIVLAENTRRLDLDEQLDDQVYCQRWNCLGYTAFIALSGVLGWVGYPMNECRIGAAALHASERDALMREYDITTERSSAETFLKATFCPWCALSQESREITIRQHLEIAGLLYEPPQPEEMNRVFT